MKFFELLAPLCDNGAKYKALDSHGTQVTGAANMNALKSSTNCANVRTKGKYFPYQNLRECCSLGNGERKQFAFILF